LEVKAGSQAPEKSRDIELGQKAESIGCHAVTRDTFSDRDLDELAPRAEQVSYATRLSSPPTTLLAST